MYQYHLLWYHESLSFPLKYFFVMVIRMMMMTMEEKRWWACKSWDGFTLPFTSFTGFGTKWVTRLIILWVSLSVSLFCNNNSSIREMHWVIKDISSQCLQWILDSQKESKFLCKLRDEDDQRNMERIDWISSSCYSSLLFLVRLLLSLRHLVIWSTSCIPLFISIILDNLPCLCLEHTDLSW